MVVAQGEDPRALVRKALESLGGVRRFIARGDVVVIKPNIAWDRTPEQGANTNPLAVAEMVRQCLDAGAKKVIVTDVSCNEPVSYTHLDVYKRQVRRHAKRQKVFPHILGVQMARPQTPH